MKTTTILVGIMIGLFVGFELGISFAVALGYLAQFIYPDDRSAASIADMVILTAPMGALIGATYGGMTIASRPRLFLASFLPLALFFMGFYIIGGILKGVNRERHFVLEVDGTSGADFLGSISLDGTTSIKKGKIPAKFEYHGLQIKTAFALIEPNARDFISINISVNSARIWKGNLQGKGASAKVSCYGYSEYFGGRSSSMYLMTQEEVDRFIKDQSYPKSLLDD